jgi:hypothetical protein
MFNEVEPESDFFHRCVKVKSKHWSFGAKKMAIEAIFSWHGGLNILTVDTYQVKD